MERIVDDEMIERLVPILLKHNPQTHVGAAIVLVELLTAMREPTEKMLGAIHGCYPDTPDKYASEAAKIKWYAAIDVIIGDK